MIVLLTTALSVWAPRAQAAETVSLSVAPATIVDGAPAAVTVSGDSVAGDAYAVISQPASAGACAAGPPATGEDLAAGSADPDTSGAFQSATAVESDDFAGGGPAIGPGSYRVCAWLTDGGGTVSSATSTVVTITPVAARVSIEGPATISPTDSLPTVTVDYAVDAPAILYADVRPVGRPCATSPTEEPAGATPLLSQGSPQPSIGPPGGESSGKVRYPVSITSGDTIQLCAWIEPDGGAAIDAGPASERLHQLTLSSTVDAFSGRSSQHRPVNITLESKALAASERSPRSTARARRYTSEPAASAAAGPCTSPSAAQPPRRRHTSRLRRPSGYRSRTGP
jgi:hypothetical protein